VPLRIYLRKQVPDFQCGFICWCMNIINALDEIRKTTSYLKSEFEIKDLGKTRFELDYRVCGILIHRYTYVQKMIRRFNMNKAYTTSTPMIGQSVRYKEISISSKGWWRESVRSWNSVPKYNRRIIVLQIIHLTIYCISQWTC